MALKSQHIVWELEWVWLHSCGRIYFLKGPVGSLQKTALWPCGKWLMANGLIGPAVHPSGENPRTTQYSIIIRNIIISILIIIISSKTFKVQYPGHFLSPGFYIRCPTMIITSVAV